MKNGQWPLIYLLAFLGCCCNKQAGTNARLIVLNGTHSVNALTARWNGNAVNANPLAPAQYSGTTGNTYTDISAGTNNILVQNGTTTLLDKNIYASPFSTYTLLAYDTSKSAGSTRMLYLADDIQSQEADTSFMRFLYLVPDTTAVDVILLKSTKNDTIFINSRFIGKDADELTVEAFFEKNYGDVTGIKINKTGTSVALLSSGSYSFQKNYYYSIVYSGLADGSGSAAPQLKVIRH